MMRLSLFICAVLGTCLAGGAAQESRVAALFEDGAIASEPTVPALLKDMLAEAGYRVVSLNGVSLCEPSALAESGAALLVFPDASRLPMRAASPVREFLKRGGDLLALNTPAWKERWTHFDGEWLTLEEYRKQRAGTTVPNLFLDFGKESLESWQRSAYRMEANTRFSLEPAGDLGEGKTALFADMPEMENWDSACRFFEASPFLPNHVMTVFSAKGGPGTTRLAIEWREKDGSRWIASVPLSQEWQQYTLLPEEFKFWESVSSRSGSCMNPENVEMISFTLSYSHTGFLHGRHRFWVADVGTAPLNEAYRAAQEDIPAPALEILSPAYKFYDMNDVVSLVSAEDQCVLTGMSYELPASMRSLHPRPEAGGFDKKRSWRWLPLLEARGSDGTVRGYPAAMMIHGDGEFKGGLWASFAIDDPRWYASESGKEALRATINRMNTPLFLLDGGAEFYTGFEGQPVRLGAMVVNAGAQHADHLSIAVAVTGKNGEEVGKASWSDLAFPRGTQASFASSWTPPAFPEEGYRVEARLLQGDTLVDVASHDLYFWHPKERRSYVSVENGRFVLDGQRWRPHGVNYMPSSGIGVEWQEYFEKWLGAAAYHPRVIQRDLERCAAMGCNALSIFVYHDSMKSLNLVDFLRRMDGLGMKANVSLRPGTPMEFPWDTTREMIEFQRLAENDTVFAYDLAWEPQFRDWERNPFNPAWEAWIVERYGSLENAEKDWGCPVPRDAAGKVVNFSPHMITESGPWDRMLAAYRRFLDTLLYEKYSGARSLVKSVDPHHHVSFRMSMAGDPTDRQTGALLYDFAYLGGAVDIFEPEGYGRIGDWEKVKPGWFTREYARWANADLPMIWAEAGVHVWDMTSMSPSEERLAFQETYYTDYYRMMMDSGADGVFWWWYPGGFRANENSDYGVINPDGTDRPVTRVIREHAARFAGAPDARPVDAWLAFDRDSHNNGLTGIYDELKEAFWTAIEEGKTPGLRTEATGSDSISCPALAVGNTALTGNNPPKYLDAFFDSVEVLAGSGTWKRILPGETLAVGKGIPLRLRLAVTNLGEAALATPDEAGDKPGGVFIAIEGDVTAAFPLPKRLERFEQAVVEMTVCESSPEKRSVLTVRFNAKDRSAFGSPFRMVLEP